MPMASHTPSVKRIGGIGRCNTTTCSSGPLGEVVALSAIMSANGRSTVSCIASSAQRRALFRFTHVRRCAGSWARSLLSGTSALVRRYRDI